MAGKPRILAIEDNVHDRSLVAFLLTAFGYDALTAERGAEGVETARRELPDLILLDILMPGMDGFATLRALREEPLLKRTPVVALTILSSAEERRTALAAGFDGYIAKPILPEGFAELVAELVAAGRTRAHDDREAGAP